MATNKRTVIGADEELLVKGQLVVTGNVTQVETTQTINRLESDELVINADSDAVTAKLQLNGETDNAILSYNSGNPYISVNKSLVFPASSSLTVDIIGDVTGQVSDISNHNTDSLSEGATNLYFTTPRFNNTFDTRFGTKSTDGLTEGFSNLYFTNQRAREAISVSDNGGDGSLTYNSTSGVISYTGPSAAEVRAHFSGGAGITYNSGSGLISTNDSQIDIHNLSGYVANEHIDHSGVTLTAGAGLTGGGDITASRTFAIGQGTGITVDADSISTNDSQIDIHSLSGYVADEHIDHSSVVLTAGDGLTGGGAIDASRSLAVDTSVVRTSGNQSIGGIKTFTGTVDLTGATVTVQTEANADSDFSVASTAYVNNRINQVVGAAPSALDTLEEIAAAMGNSSNLGGVVTSNTNRIGSLESRNIIAGAGLIGGGNLSADRTINIAGGQGITVNANDINVAMTDFNTGDLAEGTNLYYTDGRADARVNLQTGSNLDLSAKDTDDLSQGTTNLYYTNAKVESYLGGGDGINFASGTIDVDGTVIRTTGNQSLAGTKSFSGTLVVPNSASTTAGAIYYDSSGTDAYIYVAGQARKITPAVDAGDVEGVGAGATDVYAGTRVDGSTVYHGIKSIDEGTYTNIGETGNVITIDADINAIKGQFSASGSTLSYNSGIFTTTADNYNNWNFTTPTGGNVVVNSNQLVTFAAGSGIQIGHVDKTITITNVNAADITAVSAGAGLTGGGTTGGVTLNVGTGDGITINTNDVAVDSTVVRTSGTQSIAGNKTLTGSTQINSLNVNGEYSFPTADGSSSQVLTTNGSGTLQFQNVSALGLTNVFAGDGLTRSTGVGTVTVDVGAGNGINVTADEVTVDDAYIRSLFSGGSDIAYNSSTGQFSYSDSDRSDATIRGLFSGSNGVNYNSASGAITGDTAEIRAMISAAGDLSYNSAAGEISFTERTDSEVRALFSGGTNINYDSATGSFSTASDIQGVGAGDGLSGGGTTGSVNLAVDSTVVRTSGNQSIAGNKTFTGQTTFDDSSNMDTPVKLNDEQMLRFGNGNDMTILHDSTGTYGNGIAGVNYIMTNSSLQFLINPGLNKGVDFTDSNPKGYFGYGTSIQGVGDEKTFYASYDGVTKFITTSTGIRTVGTVNVNNAYTLPSSDGSSGQVLTTDGAGGLTFATPTVGDITGVSVSGTGLSGGGTSGAVTITSNATSANTGGAIVARDGSGNFSCNVMSGQATSARYADLAEKYESDANYQEGTVVVFGGEKEITIVNQANSPRVAGVISTEPAYMMNSEAEGQYVALRGRVPCKVIGPVKKGDVLITSSRAGFAETSSDPAFVGAACIVGKALGEWDSPSEGVVEIVV